MVCCVLFKFTGTEWCFGSCIRALREQQPELATACSKGHENRLKLGLISITVRGALWEVRCQSKGNCNSYLSFVMALLLTPLLPEIVFCAIHTTWCTCFPYKRVEPTRLVALWGPHVCVFVSETGTSRWCTCYTKYILEVGFQHEHIRQNGIGRLLGTGWIDTKLFDPLVWFRMATESQVDYIPRVVEQTTFEVCSLQGLKLSWDF